MVPSRQLRAAVCALEGAGGDMAMNDWPSLVKDAKGEMTMTIRGLPLIDLHWHLVSKGRARQRYALPSDELIERRHKVSLGQVEAWALEPTDFAAHIALHATFSGTHRLRWLVDIERTLVNQPPDWDELVRRCQAWRVGLPVSVALNRARETVGARVPKEVITDLAGGNLQRFVIRQLGGWMPAGHMPGGRSVKNGVARSLRDSLLTSTTEFAGETWQTLGDLVRAKSPGAGTHHRGEGPGQVSFENYLDLVSRVDTYGHSSKVLGNSSALRK
jgi:hypothetical protein